MRMSIIPILAAAVILAACGPADAGNGAASQTAPVAQVGFNDLLRDPGVPFIGAEAADVTIISFIDYNCPYCKRMQPELAGIVEADPRVRVLYKEWPIFGDASEQASRIAIAASYQGMYEEAHNAFMAAPTTRFDWRERQAWIWRAWSRTCGLGPMISTPCSSAQAPRLRRWLFAERPPSLSMAT
jgi:protein-disulfide isomerase